jgi:flotillin
VRPASDRRPTAASTPTSSRSASAGPLANARAQKDVGIAVEEAEAARVQARTDVERRRSQQAPAALQADVIAPPEAQRQADIARAKGQRQAAILAAQAEADGIQAKLQAEAAGKKENAAALNTKRAEAAPTADAARRAGLGPQGHRGRGCAAR